MKIRKILMGGTATLEHVELAMRVSLMSRHKPLPTGLEILDRIYNRYYDDFTAFDKSEASRNGKIHVPIDISSLAEELGIDADVGFGRLYYHLQKKYGYKREENDSSVVLFDIEVGGERHAVNFPYLASALAGMREENTKFRMATIIAMVSLVVSVVSFCISIFG